MLPVHVAAAEDQVRETLTHCSHGDGRMSMGWLGNELHSYELYDQRDV